MGFLGRPAIAAFIVVSLLALSASASISAQPMAPPAIEAAVAANSDLLPAERVRILRFYAVRNGALAWIAQNAFSRDGKIAIDALQRSAEQGLDPHRYGAAKEQAAWRADTAGEIRLTAAVLEYAADMLNGRLELRSLDRDIDLPFDGTDVPLALDHALRAGKLQSFLQGLEPESRDYAGLKVALARYRDIEAKGGWPTLDAAKPFHADDAKPGLLSLLAQRLAFEDDTIGNDPTADDVDAAIQRFQLRNGLDADGTVGPKTLALLNMSAGQRAQLIAVNMERLRWLPHRLEPVRIVVNAPDTKLTIFDHDREVLVSAVIVGKPSTRTPIFRAEVTQVIANPSWNVPAAIARGEILPRVARDPGYLARHNMIIVDGRVVQLPGKSNALGDLKVDLDDRFAVYLHDTPSRKLFDKRDRFFSHGCIRVAQIYPLASYALGGDAQSAIEQLVGLVAAMQTVHLPIKSRIPVYVTYATVFPSATGLQFRNDVYGRDARMIAAMNNTRFASAGCHGRG